MPRRLAVGGLQLLVAMPTVISAAVVAANPRHLAVVSMAEPHEGFWRWPVEFVVLDDGATAMVEYGQVSVCRDVRCVDEFASRTPCRDGGAPQPIGGSARSCSNEGSIDAAELTPDGTLLALTRTVPENEARLYWCEVEPNRDGQCQWGGASTVQALPTPWENWSMAIASTPTGGYAIALLGPGADELHGRVLLVTCDRLDCPQPTVQPVLEIALPDGWWGAGVVDIDIDRASGALALGYADPNEGSVWLGGCPAGCPGGPALTRVDAWFAEPGSAGSRQQASLEVVATPSGPLAVAARWPGDEPRAWHGTAIDCDDPACVDLHMDMDSWVSAWPVVDSAGTPFVVGTYGEDRPVLRNLDTGALTLLAGTGRVVAAAFGPDDRLHIVLSGPEQRPTLVTCAIDHCPLP
jgi:hypothetical protein